MAKPADGYPESATNGARKARDDGEGEAALRAALAAHGDDLAGAVERTDELGDALTTAILVAATADDAEVERITDSTANLVAAADGISTDGAADLAAEVGENADDLGEALETVLALQRSGTLDDLVALADALSSDETERLAAMLETDGAAVVDALDLALDLQRDGHLEDLLDLVETASALEMDDDTARGLNSLLGAVGEATRESEPLGPLGALRQLFSRDARAGVGYLVAVLKSQGRRLRE
jgi:uncharacterized protein YjgD (DUF1641 family)